jgi:hypothetical protein
MLAQFRLEWRLLIGLLLIVSVVSAVRSDKKSSKNNQQKVAHQRLDEIQGSGQPPKPGASVDDEIATPASGRSPNPDDEDSVPVVEGSGQPPPQNIVKPTTTTTKRPTTTSTEPNELKIEDQEDTDDDMDDDDDMDEDEEDDLSPVLRPNEPETTSSAPSTTSSTTTSTATPRQVFEIATRPPTTTNAPTFPSKVDSVSLDMLRPGLLAAISGGAVVGLLLTILLVMFVVYRMRKKDEGSYSLDEGQHQPPHYSYAYQKAPTKEFYA